MNPSVFESNWFSLTLSWLFSIPILLSLLGWGISILVKHDNIPWILSVWVGICVVVFSPARYLIFLTIAATSFPFQSLTALFDTFFLVIYVPLLYGILVLIGMGIPFLAISPFLKSKITALKGIAIALIFPVACTFCSLVFFIVLPFAGMTLGWVKAKDIIKSTNGPAAVYFKYVLAPTTPLALPPYFEDTPQKDIDLLRCHVASVFLPEKRVVYFLKHQYPNIYETLPKSN